jgi:uncharacterized protein (DUF58 family)
VPDSGLARKALARILSLPRPTRFTSLLLLLAVILEILGRLIHSTGVTLAAASAVGAVIGDALLTPSATYAVDRRTPARMAVGVEAPVQVRLSSRGRRLAGRRPVVLIDRAPGLDIGRYVTPALRRGEQATAERVAMPLTRGAWTHGGRVDVEAYSPLGAWVRRGRVRITESGWVHPAPATPLRLPDTMDGERYGRATSTRRGRGVDFYGIREWRAGDATSAIHWRASARRDQLVVMERERPGLPALVVACGPLADNEAAERLLARVAATTLHALRDGRGVTLVADAAATTVTRPLDALDWFAGLAPGSDPTPEARRSAFREGGGGATLLWLGAGPIPAAVAAAARGGMAAAAVRAVDLVNSGPRP